MVAGPAAGALDEPTDWGALYVSHVDALTLLVRDLDESALATSVPATPAWTVRDVVAHLAGGPADAVAGRTDGAPGPAWTARHVAERSHLPVDVLLAELRENQDWVAHTVSQQSSPGTVWDIAVHHADLHEALGLGIPPTRLWGPVLAQVAPRWGGQLFGQAPDYEVFRALFSRRSRTQMRSWATTLDDATLDAVCAFGPREDDQPVPR